MTKEGCALSYFPVSRGRSSSVPRQERSILGAFDPFPQIVSWAREHDAWLHVDGAFGLWALADPTRQHLVTGLTEADSWATDAHKWLNVSYDSGTVFVRNAEHLRRSFASVADYLPSDNGFEAMHHTP